MKLTEDNFVDTDEWDNSWWIKPDDICMSDKDNPIKKQILENQEKAEKLDLLNIHKDHLAVLHALGDEVEKNKQLKASIENIENANEMWKERAEGFVELVNEKADVMIENQNLKQKLEKIEEWYEKQHNWQGVISWNILKEILESKA